MPCDPLVPELRGVGLLPGDGGRQDVGEAEGGHEQNKAARASG